MQKDSRVSKTTRSMRVENRCLVLSAIRERRQVSRSDLSVMTGLTEAAISRICRELIDVELLVETDDPSGNRKIGRPSINLQIAANGAFVLGFDISANSQSICLVNARGDVLARRRLELDFSSPPVQTLKLAAAAANHLVKANRIDRRRLLGAGIAVAGVVDAQNRHLITAPNLDWGDVDIAGVLEGEVGISVHVESRPRALLQAEYQAGAARGKRNIALVQASLGIGGALILDGNVAWGEQNAAGQVGHLPFVKGGELCSCGRRGCLDTVASGHAILTKLRLIRKRRVKAGHGAADAALLREAIKKANGGNARVFSAFQTAGSNLGIALRTVAMLLDPEVVILSGTVMRVPCYYESVVESFSRFKDIPIVKSIISEEDVGSYLALNAFVFSSKLDFEHIRTGVLG